MWLPRVLLVNHADDQEKVDRQILSEALCRYMPNELLLGKHEPLVPVNLPWKVFPDFNEKTVATFASLLRKAYQSMEQLRVSDFCDLS